MKASSLIKCSWKRDVIWQKCNYIDVSEGYTTSVCVQRSYLRRALLMRFVSAREKRIGMNLSSLVYHFVNYNFCNLERSWLLVATTFCNNDFWCIT